jgi:cobalt-zinc-cadmium efflux system protein
LEIIGGFWTNSIAILSDAVHDLGDSISLGLAWHFDRISKQGRTEVDTYGRRRYSLLGGLITAAVLVVGISFVLWSAVSRLASPQPVNAQGMMALAVLGVLFNGFAALRLRSGASLTERVGSWHLIEDTLGWVAVLIGAAVMTVWNVPILDPLLSIGISLFVLWNVFRTLRHFAGIFLQQTPPGFEIATFERQVLDIDGVIDVRHTHGWSIDGESHVLTTHVLMNAGASRDQIVAVKARLREMLAPSAFEHVTVDFELEGEESIHRPGALLK